MTPSLFEDDAPFPIYELDDGEKITEPGFYRITLDRHHNQPCDGLCVTSSILRTIELQSLAEVYAFHPLNPDRYEKPETDALREGRAMALLVEGGPDALKEYFTILGPDTPKKPTKPQRAAFERTGEWSDAAKDGAKFWAEVEASGKSVLKMEDYAQLLAMSLALRRDPGAVATLDGIPELTMAWKDEATGIWLLSRPDMVNFDGFVGDYKKVAAQNRPFNGELVDRRITDHGYDMQLAFAAEVLEKVTGHFGSPIWPEQAAILAQSDKVPYHPLVREISQEDLRIGQYRNRSALKLFANAVEQTAKLKAQGRDPWQAWPGPGAHSSFYKRPEWQTERLLQRMDVTAPDGRPEEDNPAFPRSAPPAEKLDDSPITMMG